MTSEGDSTESIETGKEPQPSIVVPWVTVVLKDPKGNWASYLTFSIDTCVDQIRAAVAAQRKGMIDPRELVAVLTTKTWDKLRHIPVDSRRHREICAKIGMKIRVPSSDS